MSADNIIAIIDSVFWWVIIIGFVLYYLRD